MSLVATFFNVNYDELYLEGNTLENWIVFFWKEFIVKFRSALYSIKYGIIGVPQTEPSGVS